MAIFTSILNLLKKNPATDGADTFNIQTMLNDNWDKIDAALALKGANGSVRAATVSNTTLSGLQTVDGVSLAAGDRVLVKDQTTGSQNGIYVAASGAWARAADADASVKLAAGVSLYVREGTINAGKSFVLSNAGALTLGTTALTFAQLSGAGAASDAVIGNRTATDSATPAMSGTLTGLLSSLFTLVKGITGKSSALTGPAITLEATKSHVDAGMAHGAVSAPTASTMMARDSAGRAQVAAPSAAADVARKDTVDAAIATAALDATAKANAVQSNLTTHISSNSHIPYAVATGSANAYSVTISPEPSSLAAGVALAVQINVANTGASTINVNGLGAKSILTSKGAALTSGKMVANGIYTLRYNGTAFILQGEGGEYGTATNAQVLSGFTIGTEAGIATGSMPNRSGIQLGASAVLSDGGGGILLTPLAGYYDGSTSKSTAWDPNFIPTNIMSGKTIFGLTGTAIQGKRYAAGTASTHTSVIFTRIDGTLQNMAKLDVTGLNFTPRAVIIYDQNGYFCTALQTDAPVYSGNQVFLASGTYMLLISPASVFAGGFSLPVSQWDILYYWYAFE